MMKRHSRSLQWLGAVAAALLLALPALADEIEPEPAGEEAAAEPETQPAVEAEVTEKAEADETRVAVIPKRRDRNFDQIVDLLIIRPFEASATIVGFAFFLPTAVVLAPTGGENIQYAWDQFVGQSLERTFQRPLGEL